MTNNTPAPSLLRRWGLALDQLRVRRPLFLTLNIALLIVLGTSFLLPVL